MLLLTVSNVLRWEASFWLCLELEELGVVGDNVSWLAFLDMNHESQTPS